jgi:hypothetical protein
MLQYDRKPSSGEEVIEAVFTPHRAGTLAEIRIDI